MLSAAHPDYRADRRRRRVGDYPPVATLPLPLLEELSPERSWPDYWRAYLAESR